MTPGGSRGRPYRTVVPLIPKGAAVRLFQAAPAAARFSNGCVFLYTEPVPPATGAIIVD